MSLVQPILEVHFSRPTSTHEALVKLSIRPEDESIALVTTNFDHLFEFACHKLNLQHKYFSAPALPIPKKSKWDGIVYLHGLLPKQENVKELKSLVLTSGDFGLAYLTERWAARFITDLFRNYSVCFVGYSLNDTVMRYIADAIAADRALGEALPNMWAFVPYSETQLEKEKIEENWKIRGIEPILYSAEDDHRALHETLQMWANIYADGPESKEHLVTTHANLDPLKSTKEDDFVARVLWALADKSGNPAKVFASLEPKPSLEWLKIFSESSEKNSEDDSQVLFSTNPSITQNCSVFVFPEKDADWDAPHIHIISWVLKYLNDERLLLWLLQKGRHLRPFFKQQIRSKLEKINDGSSQTKETLDKQMVTLWRLYLADKLRLRGGIWRDFNCWWQDFEKNNYQVTFDLRLELRRCLAPMIVVSPVSPGIMKGVSLNLALATEDFGTELDSLDWHGTLHLFIEDFQQILQDLLALSKEVFEKEKIFSLPSIKPHFQNQLVFDDCNNLIELLRDAWIELYERKPHIAKPFVESWLNDSNVIFKRLGLFAATFGGTISGKRWVDYLVKNRGEILWDFLLGREVMRLIAERGAYLSQCQLRRLEKAILEEGNVGSERTKGLYLIKLYEAGANISKNSLSFLKQLGYKLDCTPSSDQRDEFYIWYTPVIAFDTKTPISPMPSTQEEVVIWITEHYFKLDSSDDGLGLRALTQWRKISEEHLTWALQSLKQLNLSLSNDRELELWKGVLSVASSDDCLAQFGATVAKDIEKLDTVYYKKLSIEIAWWVYSASKQAVIQQDSLLSISRKILSNCKVDFCIQEYSVLEQALSHPLGMLAMALIHFLFAKDLRDNQGLDKGFKEIFEKILDIRVQIYQPARIILFCHTIGLYRTDNNWATKNLLPLLDQQKNSEAVLMWRSLVVSLRFYGPFLTKVSSIIFGMAKHYSKLRFEAGRYADFMTYVALNKDRIFSDSKLKEVFCSLPVKGLEQIAFVLRQYLENSDKKSECWEKQIRVFFEKFWPVDREKRSSELSVRLIKVALQSGDKFPQAVSVVAPFLIPLERELYSISHEMACSGVCEKYPEASLLLLENICPSAGKYIQGNFAVKQCLKLIGQNDDIGKLKRYKQLNNRVGAIMQIEK